MWQRILVPIDFSPCSVRALGLAAELAKVHDATLVLLHVSDLPGDISSAAPIETRDSHRLIDAGSYAERGALRKLEEMAAPLRAAGIRYEAHASVGEITTAILTESERTNAAVLILGTHGRSGVARFLSGSVAEQVVRRANVPVITVRVESPDAQPTPEERAIEDELDG